MNVGYGLFYKKGNFLNFQATGHCKQYSSQKIKFNMGKVAYRSKESFLKRLFSLRMK